MRTINLQGTSAINGVYLTPANKVIGIPLFRQDNQEFRETSKFIELWQKNGDGMMHLRKCWRKKTVAFIEYDDLPNTWVVPRTN
jgi:hypothetical protein